MDFKGRLCSLLAITTLAFSAAAAEDGVIDRVAAVVNGDVITLSDVYELGGDFIRSTCDATPTGACYATEENRVLDALIRQKLIAQELKRLGVSVTANEVEDAIQTILREYNIPDRETLKREVERTGNSWTAYRQKLADDLRQQRFQGMVLQNRITIQDDEVLDLYKRATRDIQPPQLAAIQAFGFKLPENDPAAMITYITQFRRTFDEVRQGKRSWESVIEEYDTARMSSFFEGRRYKEDDLDATLSTVIFNTEAGGIAEPVVFNGVIYGFKVLDYETGEVEIPPFEEVKEQFMNQVFYEKVQVVEDEWYEQAKREASIRMYLSDEDASAPANEAQEEAP